MTRARMDVPDVEDEVTLESALIVLMNAGVAFTCVWSPTDVP